ncbi:aminotransferase class III-fold pyridoxal phosphate-dependent enzyme, partial [Chromobacterium haemolyticum]
MNTTAMPRRSTRDYQQLDATHHINAFLDQKALNQEGPRVIAEGRGVYLWDTDGKRYLDGMSGLWCTQVGYGRQELIAAAAQQLQQLSYYNVFFHTTHPAVNELS